MRRSRSLVALTLLFISATVAMCVYPTEHDASVHVSVTPLKILIRGNDTSAAATAWQIRAPGDSALIPNVVFTWSSSDPKVATVDDAGHITGVKSGVVTIRAAAANFDKAALPGVDTLRVTAPLEIDSVVPASVRYGGRITAYGVTSKAGVVALVKFPYCWDGSGLHPGDVAYGADKTGVTGMRPCSSRCRISCSTSTRKSSPAHRERMHPRAPSSPSAALLSQQTPSTASV